MAHETVTHVPGLGVTYVPGLYRAAAVTDQLPIGVIEADRARTFAAAHVKARHPLSYADAFAVALALETGGRIVTGDPELETVRDLVPVVWIGETRAG